MRTASACAACGASVLRLAARVADIEGLRTEPFEVLVCAACGAGTTSPVPDDLQLATYYRQTFYGRLGWVGGALMQVFLRRRRAALGALSPLARVLDVGCGDGRFLECLRRGGYEVAGLEPSAAGREAARTRVGRVHVGFDELSGERFDAVTLWQVLEHSPAPAAFLASVRDVLHPQGLLVVSVPNFGSIEARAFGHRWFHLDVPRHLVHFTRDSLVAVLRRSGFAVERVTTRSLEYNPFGLLQSVLNVLPGRRNALYHVVKRGLRLRELDLGSRLVVAFALASLPLQAAWATAAAGIEETLGRGGTLTVQARRT